MPRPICFMIMPYAKKATNAPSSWLAPDGSPAPDKIDFDHLWSAALQPAIANAGFEPVRANEDVGALIIEEMIQRLAVSDLVIADVSIPNANVYYEIGMRHAAQRAGCLMCSADWAKPLFDIAQMRHIRYPLPEETASTTTAGKIIAELSEAVPKMKDGVTPFYSVFRDFPDYDYPLTHSATFRKSLEEFSAFQAEMLAARCAKGNDRRDRALALRQRYFTDRPMQKAVALELMLTLRDCTDWATTLDFIDRLPAALKALPLVKEQRALAISENNDLNTAIGSLEQLIAEIGETSERRGMLGGRYRRKWDQTKDPADLNRAIAEYEKGMKLDLNDYYPASNLARLYRSRMRKGDQEKALIAAAVTMTACERARNRGAKDEWLNATLLGAAFDAGDVEKLQELADSVTLDNVGDWKLKSTLATCKIGAALHEEATRGELMTVIERLELLLAKNEGKTATALLAQ